MLRGIFDPKGEEVTEEWRKFHNEEIHNLYSLLDEYVRMIKREEMGIHSISMSPRFLHVKKNSGLNLNA